MCSSKLHVLVCACKLAQISTIRTTNHLWTACWSKLMVIISDIVIIFTTSKPSWTIKCKMSYAVIKICHTNTCISHNYQWHGMFVMSNYLPFDSNELGITINQSQNFLLILLYMKDKRWFFFVFSRCKILLHILTVHTNVHTLFSVYHTIIEYWLFSLSKLLPTVEIQN